MKALILARKPPSEPSTVQNIVKWGIGAVHIEASRIVYQGDEPTQEKWNRRGAGGSKQQGAELWQFRKPQLRQAYAAGNVPVPSGRWPTNVVLQSDRTIADLDEQSGRRISTLTGRADPTQAHERDYGIDPKKRKHEWGASIQLKASALYADDGTASRFFKQVK
jgi:hypothetical protein